MAHACVNHVINIIEYPDEIKPAARWLLVQIADRADKDEWTCFPSHKTLAKDAGMSSRSVLSLLDGLESCGLISRKKQTRGDGTRSTDLITVARTAIPSPPEDQPQDATETPAKVAAHNHGTEPGKEKAKTDARPRLWPKSRFCPADWSPTVSHSEKALELGVSPEHMGVEEQKFRECEFKDPKTNWDLGFHRWLRIAADRMKESGHDRGRQHASPDRSADRSAARMQAVVEGARFAVAGGRRRWGL